MRDDIIRALYNMSADKIITDGEMKAMNTDECYYYTMLNANKLYNLGLTGDGMKVGIIDTGADTDHPALVGKIVNVRNFTSDNKTNVEDGSGHGTNVASLIAGNSYGVFTGGIAKNASLVICKALDDSGDGNYTWLINAINYCIGQGVDAINMSLGGGYDDPNLHEAIKKAHDLGIILCVSSGNDAKGDYGSVDQFSYPGAYQEVIEVGAINSSKKPCSFSNSNNYVDCTCYGDNILGAHKKGAWAYYTGTSQACPLVCASMILLKQWFINEFGRKPSQDEIYAALIKCSRNITGYPRKQTGFGCIDLGLIED